MQFGKHLNKGMWAFADKALPAMYGVGFIFLVIRILPEREYGAFVFVQSMYTIVAALGYSLSFQPLTKFASETKDNGVYIVASLGMIALFFALVSCIAMAGGHAIASYLIPNDDGKVLSLLHYLPALLFSGLYRSFAVSLLQTTYAIAKIFWIDAVYFIGTLVLIAIAKYINLFSTASDVITLIIVGQVCSTLLAMYLTRVAMSVKMALSWPAVKEMWHFGKYTFGGSSVYSVFSQMDVFFISSFVGVTGVAVYSAAKIFTRIFDMLAQVAQMFLIPFSSKAFKEGAKDKLVVTAEKAICFSTIFLFPVFVAMVFFPQTILHLLYRGKYDQGAMIVQFFGLLALIAPWNIVLSNYIVGIGKAKETFFYALIFLFVAGISLYVFTGWYGVVGASAAYVFSFAFITVLFFFYVQKFFPITIVHVSRRTRDFWMFIRQNINSLLKK